MRTTINRVLFLSTLLCLSTWSGDVAPVSSSPVPQQTIETQARRPVTLTFSPATFETQFRKVTVPPSAFPLTAEKAIRHLTGAERLLKSTVTPTGTVVLYSKRQEPDQFYGAFIGKNALYEFGPIGSTISLEQTTIQVERSLDSATPILRVTGQYGANVEQTNYFYIMQEEIRPLLVVEGNITTQDLDGDGRREVITTAGTPPVTTIYRFKDGRFQEAVLNQQLQALAVQHVENTRQFNVTFKGATGSVTYEYVNGVMQPISR